jgi:hypothetical protein
MMIDVVSAPRRQSGKGADSPFEAPHKWLVPGLMRRSGGEARRAMLMGEVLSLVHPFTPFLTSPDMLQLSTTARWLLPYRHELRSIQVTNTPTSALRRLLTGQPRVTAMQSLLRSQRALEIIKVEGPGLLAQALTALCEGTVTTVRVRGGARGRVQHA